MNVRDAFGNTIYHLAVERGEHKTIASLLYTEPSLHDRRSLSEARGRLLSKLVNRRGHTLLHVAAIGGKPNMIMTLLDLHMDINSRDKCENTPVLLAATSGHIEAVHVLLERRASYLGKNKFNNSLLECDCRKDVKDLIRKEIIRRHKFGM